MSAPPSRQPATRSPPQLAAAGFALPGTLTVRAYACGKPNCRCHADPPRLHGPYAEWTRKVDGKTVTRRLTDAELTAWQPLFDNAKKIRALLAELQDLTLQIIETSPARNNDTYPQNPVGAARLTCGQAPDQPQKPRSQPKREDLIPGQGLLSYACQGPLPGPGEGLELDSRANCRSAARARWLKRADSSTVWTRPGP